jgi:hypothetical protein
MRKGFSDEEALAIVDDHDAISEPKIVGDARYGLGLGRKVIDPAINGLRQVVVAGRREIDATLSVATEIVGAVERLAGSIGAAVDSHRSFAQWSWPT